jgi:hypothetical protein
VTKKAPLERDNVAVSSDFFGQKIVVVSNEGEATQMLVLSEMMGFCFQNINDTGWSILAVSMELVQPVYQEKVQNVL